MRPQAHRRRQLFMAHKGAKQILVDKVKSIQFKKIIKNLE